MADGLRLIDVDLGQGVRAAFTTVHGGVSAGPWAGLNLGPNTEDEPRRVLANRALLERELGARVAFASQVHGADVGHVQAPPAPSSTSCGTFDALLISRAGLAVGVLVADCVPILLADPVARVGAAVHAGRRGVEEGVVQNAVDRMLAAGARTDQLRAAVGPAACGRCYEVPQQMQDEVAGRVPEARSETSWGTPALDLPSAASAQLARAGVRTIENVARCTIEDEHFYSYRRAGRTGSPTGRFAGVVVLG